MLCGSPGKMGRTTVEFSFKVFLLNPSVFVKTIQNKMMESDCWETLFFSFFWKFGFSSRSLGKTPRITVSNSGPLSSENIDLAHTLLICGYMWLLFFYPSLFHLWLLVDEQLCPSYPHCTFTVLTFQILHIFRSYRVS